MVYFGREGGRVMSELCVKVGCSCVCVFSSS